MSKMLAETLATARQQQILAAAAAVFAEKGFHAATIRDVARAADIADGTIYNYFPNKAALLIGLFEQMQHALQHNIVDNTALPSTPRDLLRTLITGPVAAVTPETLPIFRAVLAELPVNAELRTLFRERVLQPQLDGAAVQLLPLITAGKLRAEAAAQLMPLLTQLILGMVLARVLELDPAVTTVDLTDLLAVLLLEDER